MQDESLAVRNAATIIYRALGGKEKMDKIWPVDGLENANNEPIKMTKERYENILHKHKIKLNK